MPCVIVLSAVMLCVIVLNVIMLSVVMLSVVMLIVVASLFHIRHDVLKTNFSSLFQIKERLKVFVIKTLKTRVEIHKTFYDHLTNNLIATCRNH